jgi:hypothetical protein
MQRHPDPSSGIPLLLGQMATLAMTCIGATWGFALYFQSSELAGYKASRELNLPSRIEQLGEATAALRLAATERQAFAELQKLPDTIRDLEAQLATARQDSASLQHAMDERTAERDALSARLGKLVAGKRLTVDFGRSAWLVPNQLLLGVVGYLNYQAACSVVVGNRSYALKVGENVGGTVADYDWRLDMTQIDEDACEFTFAASERKPPL